MRRQHLFPASIALHFSLRCRSVFHGSRSYSFTIFLIASKPQASGAASLRRYGRFVFRGRCFSFHSRQLSLFCSLCNAAYFRTTAFALSGCSRTYRAVRRLAHGAQRNGLHFCKWYHSSLLHLSQSRPIATVFALISDIPLPFHGDTLSSIRRYWIH